MFRTPRKGLGVCLHLSLSLYRNAGMIENDVMEMVFPPASVLLVTKYGISLCCAVIPLVLYLLRGAVSRLIMIVVLPLITEYQLHLTHNCILWG